MAPPMLAACTMHAENLRPCYKSRSRWQRQARRRGSQAAFSKTLWAALLLVTRTNGQHAKLQMRCLLLVANSGLASALIPFAVGLLYYLAAVFFMSSHIGAVAVVRRRMGKVTVDRVKEARLKPFCFVCFALGCSASAKFGPCLSLLSNSLSVSSRHRS
ncbi:hypothetical protein V8C26DRAFT_228774 [Trichoderma gracile]